MPCTPLLLLLDGVLSQDEGRITQAVAQIEAANVPLPPIDQHRLLSSPLALEQVVSQLMVYKKDWAFISSRRDGSLPLHFAASIGSIPLARAILYANRNAAVTPNQKGKTALHYAAREGRADMVEFFMAEAPETASIRSKKDKLALHFAAGEGHLGVVQVLIKADPRGASLPSKKGKMAIHFAARWGHVQIARALLAISPETISTLDHEGSSPLHDAAREGQMEMMQFLVQKHPQGLKQANIRGETPLFPAVRSGNTELVKFMIHACPDGGKHVLQRVREDDTVDEWNPEILELCLRGAVNILGEDDKEESLPATNDSESEVSPCTVDEAVATAALLSMISNGHNESTSDGQRTPPLVAANNEPLNGLDIHLPRSKSPILEASQANAKKRSSTDDGQGSPKRTRLGSSDSLDPFSELLATSTHRTFQELHAALECGVSAPVLNCVLDRHGDSQIDSMDELGRMPLHIAMGGSPANNNAQIIDIILERIWKPNQAACSHRDYLGRLPLHHALMHRADAKLVKALLQMNPSSGVEHCDVLDERFMDKLPLEMAITFGCDWSTIYMMLRADPGLTVEIMS
jgi:ankyrin repeat protein